MVRGARTIFYIVIVLFNCHGSWLTAMVRGSRTIFYHNYQSHSIMDEFDLKKSENHTKAMLISSPGYLPITSILSATMPWFVAHEPLFSKKLNLRLGSCRNAMVRGSRTIIYQKVEPHYIMNNFTHTKRKSHTEIGEIYFWTATIHNWHHLLEGDTNKQLVTAYLKKLSDAGLVSIYAFVIMPNHIHLIWQQNKLNGKETPKGSLLKYTSHEFLKMLKVQGRSSLYEVNAANKKHEIWQRDSLGIAIYNVKAARQKLEYIHNNPVRGKWYLAKDYLSYPYSSARFYETGEDAFGFLKNIFTVMYGD